MPGSGGPHRAAAAERPARRRAVGMAAITRRADGKQAAAVSAGLLAERQVHGVGARGAISDWTTRSNRGTTAPTGSVLSELGAVTRVRRLPGPSPHVCVRSLPYANEPPLATPARRLWTPTRLWTQTTAPTAVCKTAQTRFRTATTAIILFFIQTLTNTHVEKRSVLRAR